MSFYIYHQKYAELSDEEIAKRAGVKEDELKNIFEHVSLDTAGENIRLAVLGCGDARFVAWHKKIFENRLGRSAEVCTFDISTEHLETEKNVFRHDCTMPIPDPPYDIAYAHVLLKFIETEKQWEVLKNSYEALREGGIAIHVLDREDYESDGVTQKDGYFSVPIDRWKERLQQEGIRFFEIPVKYGLALVLKK